MNDELKRKILLVSKDIRLCSEIKQAFESANCLVEEVFSPLEALVKVTSSLDLIICDLTFSSFHSIAEEILSCDTCLPASETYYQNGVLLLECVRRLGLNTKFVFLCNGIGAMDHSLAKLYGSTVHITKPFKMADLISFVKDWLNIGTQTKFEKPLLN
jgi:DNA-binding response OmpR family regulator